MELTLSWDLFIIVFFAIVVTYSFIIGMHEAVKIILATYVSIVAVQGLGTIIDRLTNESQQLLSVVGLEGLDLSMVSIVKLVVFVGIIIFLTVKGGFDIDYQKDTGGLVGLVFTALIGFATAGLLLSTLLSFVADAPLLDGSLAGTELAGSVAGQSVLMEALLLNQALWLSLPAVLLIAVGFVLSAKAEED